MAVAALAWVFLVVHLPAAAAGQARHGRGPGTSNQTIRGQFAFKLHLSLPAGEPAARVSHVGLAVRAALGVEARNGSTEPLRGRCPLSGRCPVGSTGWSERAAQIRAHRAAALPPFGAAAALTDVVFLNGRGVTPPTYGRVFAALKAALDGSKAKLWAPSFIPGGEDGSQDGVPFTRLRPFLEEMRGLAARMPTGRIPLLVGHSLGGLLAACFQDQHPELVDKVVLIAPAIDNYERNFADGAPGHGRAPPAYVEDVKILPARPAIKVPAVLFHGSLDNDRGGSALWRISEWASAEAFEACYFPEGVDHSMDEMGAWLSYNGTDCFRGALGLSS